METAASLMGNKGTISELSQAAKDLGQTAVDGWVAVKTLNAGGTPGTPGQPNPPPSDDDLIGRFITLLVASFHKRIDPAQMPSIIGGACLVSNMDPAKLDPLLKLGSVTIVGALLEDQAKKAVDEGNKRKFTEAKAAITSPEGATWFNQVRAAYLARQGGQTQVPAAPAPPQITTTPPAAK
jgi:hypothetical protein